MQSTRQTRVLGPGLLAILVVLAGARLVAHDPGLSALDVRVGTSVIVATLSLAEVDARALEAAGAIEISIDNVPLVGELGLIEPDPSGGRRLEWRFRGVSAGRLTVTSHVPGRLARGHRELLTVRTQDGAVLAERMLDAAAHTVVADVCSAGAAATDTARRFFALGLHHIVTGYDHLLFLIGMLLVVRGLRDAAAIVTAFTAAHAVALGVAAVGAFSVPPQVVEPLIAASVIWVGVENLVRRNVTGRWLPAFGFGLVHGLAFAGALSELGVAGGESLALRLASFNVGIEAGQLALSLVVVPVLSSARQWPGLALRAQGVGSVCVILAGAYWLMQRIPAL